MTTQTETVLHVPCKKVKVIVGAKEFLMLDHGSNIMAPSKNSVSSDKGRRLLLDGPKNAQAAATFAIILRLAPSDRHASVTDVGDKCWWYISPAGSREGPFAARALMSWLAKGQLQPHFDVAHGPSRVWLPLWLLARHHELLNQMGDGDSYGPMAWPVPLPSDEDVTMADVEVLAEVRQLRAEKEFMQGWTEIAAMDIEPCGVVSLRALVTVAPAGSDGDGLSEEQLLHLPTPMEVEVRVDHHLLPLQPLETPADPDSDRDPQQHLEHLLTLTPEQQLQYLQQQQGLPQQHLAALRRLWVQLVVDTNVLLLPEGREVLRALREQFGPRGQAALQLTEKGGEGGADGAPRAAASLVCVAVLPWTVLVELDGLKGGRSRRKAKGEGDGGSKDPFADGPDGDYESPDERPVAAVARAALSQLRAALDAGDEFYTAQSLAMFREACTHPASTVPLGQGEITNDDRILQCALKLQADSATDQAPPSGVVRCVVLLSNDNALCLKARMAGVLALSTHHFRGPAAHSGVGPRFDPDRLWEALMAAVPGQEDPLSRFELLDPAVNAGRGVLEGPGGTAVETTGQEGGLLSAGSGSSRQTSMHRLGSDTPGGGAGAGGGLGHSAPTSAAPGIDPDAADLFIVSTSGNGQRPTNGGLESISGPASGPGSGGGGGGSGGGGGGSGGGGGLGSDALVGEFDLDELTDPLVAALHGQLRRLTRALAPRVWDIMLADYGDAVAFVTERQPPWGGADLLEVLHRHWRSTFAEKVGRDRDGCIATVDGMLKDVRYFERGRGRPRREPRFLQVAEDFGRGVETILRGFGVHPPPSPPLPVALLALRGGGGMLPVPPGASRGSSASSLPNSALPSPSGGFPSGGGAARPQEWPSSRQHSLGSAGLPDAVALAAAGSVQQQMQELIRQQLQMHEQQQQMVQQQQQQRADAPHRTLHPAAMRAAALAQSIGLSVNMGRGQGGAAKNGEPTSPHEVAAVAAAAAARGTLAAAATARGQEASGQAAAARLAAGAGASSGGAAAPNPAAALAAQLQEALLAGAASGNASGLDQMQLAHMLQHLMVAQQQQRMLQHRHSANLSPQGQDSQAAPPLRAASESGRGDPAHPSSHPHQHPHQQQLLLEQQQRMLERTLHRFHSDPAPGGEAAGVDPVALAAASLATSASASKSGSVSGADPRVQAEAAARQLQLLHLQHQQHQHQQQQAAAAALQVLAHQAAAQRAAVEAEAQAQAQTQAHVQHLARAHSNNNGPAAAATGANPAAAAAAAAAGGAGASQSDAWHALLAETHSRQQQQHQHSQHLQLLLQQQQQQHQQQLQKEQAGGGAAGEAGSGAAMLGAAGLSPEVLAALRQVQQLQEHQKQLALMQQQMMQQ